MGRQSTTGPTQRRATMPLTLGYLNFSAWVGDSSSTRREQSTFFRLRTMASDVEERTFIPTTSHSAANCSSAAEGLGLKKSTEPHHPQKAERFPNQMPSSPWLRLGIMSMKNRKQDRWQGADLVESNYKQVWLADAALALVIQGCTEKYLWYPILPQQPPTESLGEHGQKPSLQNARRLDGQTPMIPSVTLQR